jgi:uncharacterized repeat protein (TIGR01451 family)
LSLTTSNLVCASGTNCFADLAVTASMFTNIVTAGSNFTLTITVTNRGPSPATYVTLTNVFPFGYIAQSADVSQGSWASSSGAGGWSIGTIQPGYVASAIFTGKCLLSGSFTNVSTASSFTSELAGGDNVGGVGFVVLKGSGSGLGISTNTPPVLAALSDRTVHAGSRVRFVALASDTESPTNALNFSLMLGAPVGATIDPASGEFEWQTVDADANTTHPITIEVNDAGNPPLADNEAFIITVVSRPLITDIALHGDVVAVSWVAVAGQEYQLQVSTNLLSGSWEAAAPDLVANSGSVTYFNAVGSRAQQFYRVLALP